MKNILFKKQLIAFTLAEVLITLGIIGVVVAITIPTLIKNTQDLEFKSAWKKDFSVLSQASISYLQDNSTFLGASNYANLLSPYLKVAKYCPTHASTEGCWVPSGSNYYLKTAFGSSIAGTPDNWATKDLGLSKGLVLVDGTTIATLDIWNAGCSAWGAVCGWILVDVNGFKAPNTVGRDVYGVWVLQDKIISIGATSDPSGYAGCANGDGFSGNTILHV